MSRSPKSPRGETKLLRLLPRALACHTLRAAHGGSGARPEAGIRFSTSSRGMTHHCVAEHVRDLRRVEQAQRGLSGTVLQQR